MMNNEWRDKLLNKESVTEITSVVICHSDEGIKDQYDLNSKNDYLLKSEEYSRSILELCDELFKDVDI